MAARIAALLLLHLLPATSSAGLLVASPLAFTTSPSSRSPSKTLGPPPSASPGPYPTARPARERALGREDGAG